MRTAVGIAAGLGLIAFIAWATWAETRVECEVCIDFAGSSACRSVAAADRDHAVQMAVSNACALLASGVTQGLECSRTPPRSLRCTE